MTPLPPFVQPTPAEMLDAQRLVDSHPVISAYASCEWDELDDNGKIWIAALVREARRSSLPKAGEAGRVEAVAKALAKVSWLNWDERCAIEAGADDCDSSTCIAAGDEDHDPDAMRGLFREYAKAAIAALASPQAGDGVAIPAGVLIEGLPLAEIVADADRLAEAVDLGRPCASICIVDTLRRLAKHARATPPTPIADTAGVLLEPIPQYEPGDITHLEGLAGLVDGYARDVRRKGFRETAEALDRVAGQLRAYDRLRAALSDTGAAVEGERE